MPCPSLPEEGMQILPVFSAVNLTKNFFFLSTPFCFFWCSSCFWSMVVRSYQQFRHVRSSAIPPGFLSDGVCTHVSLWAWYGKASSLPLEKGMLGWSPPRPQHSRCRRLTRCRLFVQLFQQSQLLLLYWSARYLASRFLIHLDLLTLVRKYF